MGKTQKKWDAIYKKRCLQGSTPDAAQVLIDYAHLLPKEGLALDLACGLGGNAFLLANSGLTVDAWDISSTAITHIQQQTIHCKNHITASVKDILNIHFPENYYDIIVVSRFLEKSIIKKIISALKPKGLLFYQTFTLVRTSPQGPSNPAFLLKKNELLSLFSELSPVIYREEGTLGEIGKGLRNEAMLIAQKD
ncbi:MAG: tellurite resistance methyltransferase TehB [Piscirickettsiaceae bacterium]|nr:MAG: tellurite resistance methyltransferase TehB [Piscirickettsiaceae bacterium]